MAEWLTEHLIQAHGWDEEAINMCWDLREHHKSYDHGELDHSHVEPFLPCPHCGGPYPWLWIRDKETKQIVGCTHDVDFTTPGFGRFGRVDGPVVQPLKLDWTYDIDPADVG